MLSFSEESKIAEAIRTNDAAALASVVEGLGFAEFDEVTAAVISAGGGSYVKTNQIVMGETVIKDHYGNPQVQHKPNEDDIITDESAWL